MKSKESYDGRNEWWWLVDNKDEENAKTNTGPKLFILITHLLKPEQQDVKRRHIDCQIK